MRLKSLFLLRSVDPPLDVTFGKRLVGARRIGKRVEFELEDDWPKRLEDLE